MPKIPGKMLVDGAIVESKIGTGAVTADKLGAGSVVEDKLGAGSVVEVKIGAGAVTADKIGAGAVTAGKIADGGVDVSSRFAAGVVDTAAMASGAVTQAKLDTSLYNQLTLGRSWKEALLVSEQLVTGASGGVAPAIAMKLNALPTANDTLILRDVDVTETFTFQGSESVAFDVAIGGSASATMTNLAQAINDDSTKWGAVVVTTLDALGDPIVVIYRETALAQATKNDRIYATVGDDVYVVAFGGQVDYAISTAGGFAQAGANDGASTVFGMGRATASMLSNETHLVQDDDQHYTWDDDGNVWQQTSGSGSLADGGVTTAKLADEAVTAAKIAAAVAGPGLAGGAGAALSVNVDGVGIEISTDTLQLKDAGVTADKLAAAVAGSGLTGGAGSALAVGATDSSIVVAADGIRAAVPVTSDIRKVPDATYSTDNVATAMTITSTPAADSMVQVFVNGQLMDLGDGVKTRDCYFSGDSGTTARAISAITAADVFYWNGVIAFSLTTTDIVAFCYNV